LGTLSDFALTFQAYVHWGSFEKAAEVANARLGELLEQIRVRVATGDLE